MQDETELTRRFMIETEQPARDLEDAKDRWTTDEMTKAFEVKGFMAPFVVVRKRDTGEVGSLEFTHSPRVYFNWQPDKR